VFTPQAIAVWKRQAVMEECAAELAEAAEELAYRVIVVSLEVGWPALVSLVLGV
jgi:adenosyl cobinamide kinase/adenosyl cobinamide phosphate guanylyltransferase